MKTPPIVVALLIAVLSSTAYCQSADLPMFSVSAGQVTEASVAISADGIRVHINLTDEKRVEFSEFTLSNLKKKVRIVVAGKIVAEPHLNERIISGSMEIPVNSPEEGLSVAKALMAK